MYKNSFPDTQPGDLQQLLRFRGGGDEATSIDFERDSSFLEFKCLFFNSRSMQTEERLQELLQEADECRWDVVFINESWRGSREEIIKLQGGHKWLGSGGLREA